MELFDFFKGKNNSEPQGDPYELGYRNIKAIGVSCEIPNCYKEDNMMPEYSEWEALNTFNHEYGRGSMNPEDTRNTIKIIAQGIQDRLKYKYLNG